jgi:hypothetical protein
MSNLWNSKPKKLNFKFSEETIKKLNLKSLQHHNDCRTIMCGGVGRDFMDLMRNPIGKKWICHKDCKINEKK